MEHRETKKEAIFSDASVCQMFPGQHQILDENSITSKNVANDFVSLGVGPKIFRAASPEIEGPDPGGKI